jgi:hypothetical protein
VGENETLRALMEHSPNQKWTKALGVHQNHQVSNMGETFWNGVLAGALLQDTIGRPLWLRIQDTFSLLTLLRGRALRVLPYFHLSMFLASPFTILSKAVSSLSDYSLLFQAITLPFKFTYHYDSTILHHAKSLLRYISSICTPCRCTRCDC